MYVVVVYLYSIIIPDNSNEFTGTVVKKRWGEFQITVLILETVPVPYGTRDLFPNIFPLNSKSHIYFTYVFMSFGKLKN